MTASGRPKAVESALAPVVDSAGYVLEQLSVTAAGRRRVVRVVVDLREDAEGELALDDVAELSHRVSAALDASGAMGEAPYVLEVTSPGVDRPLTERRHWARARSRLVRAVLADGGTVTGRVQEVSGAGVTLDVDGAPRLLPFEALRRGTVEVEFSRPGAPEPDEGDEGDDDEGQGDQDEGDEGDAAGEDPDDGHAGDERDEED